ncbi:hypothetical protein FQR65_LT14894 [Abscondita terminalis]|nr:hypothetical protein FQR65_LT14894 [Abscondita terminalis]
MIRKVSPQLQIQAVNELNEVPDRIEEDLKTIRDWLKKQPHLNVRDDDQSLITFLRGCKFSLQVTKDKLDFYYTAKTIVPEFYDKRDPLLSEIQVILNAGFVSVLPEPNYDGAKIIVWNMGVCNPDTMPYLNLVKVGNMVIDILMNEDDNAVISGIHVWVDLKNCSLKYATQFTPSHIKKHLQIIEKGFPLRIKGFHVSNCPPVLEFAYNLVKSLSTMKAIKRMELYHNIEQMHAVIPQRLLPKEYGGNNGSLTDLKVVWKEKIESYREWFLKDSNFRTNESLRLGEPKTTSNVFGMEGSFRNLNVD